MKTPIEMLEDRLVDNKQNLHKTILALQSTKNAYTELQFAVNELELQNKLIENSITILKGAS